MLFSPSISKLLTLRDALLHFQTLGIDVDEALDQLRVDMYDCIFDSAWVKA